MSKPRKEPAADVLDLLHLDRARSCSLTDQIYVAIRDGIASGKLSPGMRLPASRQLARAARVARNTVLNAYDELRRQGVVVSRRGSGTVISATISARLAADARSAAKVRPVRPPAPEPVRHRTLPARSWDRAMHSSLSVVVKSHGNLRPVREALAEYLAVRGIRCSADHLFLLGARNAAIDLSLRAIAGTQTEILLESPGSDAVQALALLNHMTPLPMPVDSLGANLASALRESRAPHAVYVTPAHQDPLGVVMNAERREALTLWADLATAWVIEDDMPAGLRVKHDPPLYTSDGRTLHLGTLGYALAPFTAMSYLVVPDALVDRVAQIASLAGLEAPAAEQLAVRQLILSRSYQRSLDAARAAAEERHATFMRECEQHLLWFVARVMGAETGERAVLWLQNEFDPVSIAATLRAHDIAVERLQQLALSPVRDALVVRLDRLRTSDFAGLIRRIASIVRWGASRNQRHPGTTEELEVEVRSDAPGAGGLHFSNLIAR